MCSSLQHLPKVIVLLAQVLNIEKEEMKEIARKIEEDKRLRTGKLAKTALLPVLQDLNKLSMKFSNQSEQKISKAAKLLHNASEELRIALRS